MRRYTVAGNHMKFWVMHSKFSQTDEIKFPDVVGPARYCWLRHGCHEIFQARCQNALVDVTCNICQAWQILQVTS